MTYQYQGFMFIALVKKVSPLFVYLFVYKKAETKF